MYQIIIALEPHHKLSGNRSLVESLAFGRTKLQNCFTHYPVLFLYCSSFTKPLLCSFLLKKVSDFYSDFMCYCQIGNWMSQIVLYNSKKNEKFIKPFHFPKKNSAPLTPRVCCSMGQKKPILCCWDTPASLGSVPQEYLWYRSNSRALLSMQPIRQKDPVVMQGDRILYLLSNHHSNMH